MPVILTQHFSANDRPYEDAEMSLYHYPRVYFSRVAAYDRFVYYRPLGKSERRPDSMRYFGYGVLGVPFDDPYKSDHRFVPLIQSAYFPRTVGLYDDRSAFIETESEQKPQFQAAVRRLSETAYWRILSAGGARERDLSAFPSTEAVSAFYLPGSAAAAPRDAFRIVTEIPPGAGYVPHGTQLDVYESAALQERARADHKSVLGLVARKIVASGGTCALNNNVDLHGDYGPGTPGVLVEAKSLTDARSAVDRMRYGIGQLADYGFRYAAELRGATPLLAFGNPPDRQTSWIADVLEDAGIGFAARVDGELLPLNATGRALPLFA